MCSVELCCEVLLCAASMCICNGECIGNMSMSFLIFSVSTSYRSHARIHLNQLWLSKFAPCAFASRPLCSRFMARRGALRGGSEQQISK